MDTNHLNWMIEHYRNGLLNKSKAKILWGARSIHKKDWILLKEFFKEYKIKSVLEYGCGLSTELMGLEGIEVVSLEKIDWWADICRGAIGNEVIHYQKLPKIKRKFDMCFVDGPQTKRSEEILHARKYSDIIFLHDLRPEEVRLLNDWQIISKYGKQFYKSIRIRLDG